MSDKSTIEWTDATWNTITGCQEVSDGCDRCYARTFAERFRGVEGHPYEQGFDLKLWPDRLDLPMRWRKPRRIFVNSMSDWLHRDVPDDFILQMFDTMLQSPRHTFQLLTKRPGRLIDSGLLGRLTSRIAAITGSTRWPRHIWLGVSVETNDYVWRADKLRQVPAAIRFISAEPLLGPLDRLRLDGIHWLITGGESGNGHRPCNPLWVRDLRDRCNEQHVAFFFKQWGGRTPKAGGRELDGKTWDEMPVSPFATTQEVQA